MKIETIHLVSLDVPFPPNYGGVIDIFFRAKALKSLGIKIILHCFEYGRGADHDFKEIADTIYYYPRKRSILTNFKKDPFIVASRKSEDLVQNLLQDNFPILLEGHHCSGLLNEERLKNRLKFVRIHNIEWMYYEALAHATKSTWKKTFFSTESKKLKKFEKIMAQADAVFCLSESDREYYQKIVPRSYLWPVGCQFEMNKIGENHHFALYHGNLSVAENEKSLRWIVDTWEEFKIPLPLVIAGKNPSVKLKEFLQKKTFITLNENPSQPEMNALIHTAAVNLLITFQSTGVKLKLINALLQGKRCIVNPLMIEGTDLGQFCEIVDDSSELNEAVLNYQPYTSEHKNARLEYLMKHFDPVSNAKTALGQMED